MLNLDREKPDSRRTSSVPLRRVIGSLVALAIAWFPIETLADTLIVANKGEDTVSFIDLTSGDEIVRLETGKTPHEVAISPDGKHAAVVAYGGTTIDIFDVSAAKLARRIELFPNAAPHGIIWLKSGSIVATVEGVKGVVIVDPKRAGVRLVQTGEKGAHMLTVSPDERRAYIANIMSGTVSIIDLRRRRFLGNIDVGGYPEGIAIAPDGRYLWVGDNSGPRVRIVDIADQAIVTTIDSDPVAIRIAISPDGKTAVSSHIGSGVLNVYDVASRSRIQTIPVSGARDAVQVTTIFSRDGRTVFVAETGRNTVAEVDIRTGEVLRRLDVGRAGDGLAITPVAVGPNDGARDR